MENQLEKQMAHGRNSPRVHQCDRVVTMADGIPRPAAVVSLVLISVAATSDLAPSSRLTEVDLSRVKSSRVDDFAATSKSMQVDLDRLE